MREILFRGKRIDNGKWMYGIPYVGTDDSCKIIVACAYHPDFVDEGNVYYSEGFHVIPKTVGQYTGLKDCNGVKIFEGDIVRICDTLFQYGDDEKYHIFNGYIDFADGSFRIVGNDDVTHYCWIDYEVEVIGSIHDNPELIADSMKV